MAAVQRICPHCGTSNSTGRTRCSKCGASLGNLPAPYAASLPARREGGKATALLLGAGAVVARTGFHLLTRHVLPRLARELTTRARAAAERPAPRREVEQERAPESAPDYTIRGWRVWSVRRGRDEASGSDQFEWKISRRREGGAGKER